MTLVDTFAWIHQLRTNGDLAGRKRVEDLLNSGEAWWCSPVRLELWIGARGDHEKKVLRRYERALPEIEVTRSIWEDAYELARLARASGLTCPSQDVLIAACARHYGLQIEACDAHFPALMLL